MRGASIVVRGAASDPLAEHARANELARRFLLFDAFVGGERRVDLMPIVLSRDVHAAAVSTAERAFRVVSTIAARAHHDEIESRLYGFDDDTRALARASFASGDDAVFARVDLLWGQDGRWHACEINADCPGGHNEAVALPRLSREAGVLGGPLHDPTAAVERLADRLARASGGAPVALLYATGYAEDLQVAAIVRRALAARGVDAVLTAPTALRLRGRELFAGKTAVRALYRFYPTEWMAGQDNVGDIARAVAEYGVRAVTGFSAIYSQSKLAFARAHALAPADAGGLPLTFAVSDVGAELEADRSRWVVKRAMGRVGDQVFVGALLAPEAWREVAAFARAQDAGGEPWIAQAYVPQAPVPTPWGPLYVTLGAYVLDGRFVGYFARVTPETHVSHDALCLPVFVDASSVGEAT